jgi:hypothetical protein
MADLLVFADYWLGEGPLHPALAAKWRLDESETETAFDDVAGYAGQLYGNPQWMPNEGYHKGALFFDGIDDYVLTNYEGISGKASRTCSAWIETNGSTGNMVILHWGTSLQGQQWLFGIFSSGEAAIYAGGPHIKTQAVVNDGQWHHVAAVLNDNGSPDICDVDLYIDGELQETICSSYPIDTVKSNLVMGALVPGGNPLAVFRGKIDDVRVYSAALTSSEIRHLYQVGSALRHNPDMTADGQVNYEDFQYVAGQWNSKKPEVIISEFLASNDADNPPVTAEGQIRDGNGEASDWIELFNRTAFPIDLGGWGLSDDAGSPNQWQFPAGTILPGQSYLVLFASGRSNDEYPYTDSAGYLHTNFRLSASGEHLSLTRPDGTVACAYNSIDNGFPEQQENVSYGLLYDQEYYFARPTPGSENRSQFLGYVDAPDFSHERGYYENGFVLSLSCPTEGATIRYTTDGSEPTLADGMTYTAPINIPASTSPIGRCIRAAAFKPGYRSSKTRSKTYLLKANAAMKGLPAICLTGSPTQTFYNPDGIMAIVGGAWGNSGWYKINPDDYNNVLGQGMDFERPVSMEYMHPLSGEEFQEDCGIRVHGSAWMRPRYELPPVQGQWYYPRKFSFRLYFRSLYGNGKLRHPIMERFPHVNDIDRMVLRGGHNDITNPFVRDEMIRRLQYYMGHEASLGTFVNLFVNGDYKGYYNPCERLDEDFFQKYYDSNLEWDVVGWVQPNNVLEARDGDMVAFKEFINYAIANSLSDPVHYKEVVRQLDLVHFIDYIIVQCWGGNWDWPQNNWTASAERSPNRKWRFYVWDAEGGMSRAVDDSRNNRFTEMLLTDKANRSHLSRLFKALYANMDFRMLFADRLQRHFLEADSVMRPQFLNALFAELADEVKGVIPDISTFIPTTFIPGRQSVFFSECTSRGLFTFEGPQICLNGSPINRLDEGLTGDLLSFQNAPGQSGMIYFTLDGSDPRVSIGERPTVTILVAEDAPKRVLIPSGNIGTDWRSQVSYNDSSWIAGLPADSAKTGGVGYEIQSVGNKAYISYDVRDEMYNQRTTAYIRIPFTVNAQELATWNYLTLAMRYDDGFVAYLNGTEVCRRSFSGTPSWNSAAGSSHENNSLEEISIGSSLSALQAGENILAIHGLNVSSGSSDFLISAILTAGRSISGGGISPSAQQYTAPVPLDKSACIKARTLNGSTWSALRQAEVTIGFAAETLRISEIMYHPYADPNEEFIELVNNGTDPINLSGIRFSEGIDYAFPDVSLSAGACLLLVRNQSAFENRYSTGLPVMGQYSGALDNAGETLKLVDLAGRTIQKVDYNDNWHSLTDGAGFSLTAVDPAYDRTAELVSGAAARWAFDEPSGTAVADSAGAHPGTIYNMQNTNRVPGRQYKALRFDGVDDYIAVAGYKGVTQSAPRTCSAWIKTSASQYMVILNWGGDDGQKWLLGVYPDGQFGVFLSSGNEIKSGLIVADGYWHHVTAVLADDGSPSVNEIQLYVDGIRVNATASSTTAVDTPSVSDLSIGAYPINGQMGVFFNGLIDDVRIYDRALTANEVKLLAEGVSWSQKDLWRPSAIFGGTPGRAETAQEQLPLPGSIVINEILAHSHGQLPDWIELYNTTDQSISIGGWFLSDSNATDAELKKFQIPAGVILTPSNPYYVVEETRFNNPSDPACRIPFAFSENGETAYLQSAVGETLTGYLTQEQFGASETERVARTFSEKYRQLEFRTDEHPDQGRRQCVPEGRPADHDRNHVQPGFGEL